VDSWCWMMLIIIYLCFVICVVKCVWNRPGDENSGLGSVRFRLTEIDVNGVFELLLSMHSFQKTDLFFLTQTSLELLFQPLLCYYKNIKKGLKTTLQVVIHRKGKQKITLHQEKKSVCSHQVI